ncbi:hypothetical protein BDV93DRAFT_527924 [Ceratobasidium sp. AG-I]|nr:hypothetical protein BDV93DRAFT_527924 [Ceratobasidium sp. AG-I]
MRPSSLPLLATTFRVFQPYTRTQAAVAATRYASTSARARNLANRHWELVREHVHPATRHVVDHELTKGRMTDAGLRATTDVLPTSAGSKPFEIYVRGVRIPKRPTPPESDECCMSGCAVCVYDLYLSSLDDFKVELRSARQRLKERAVPLVEWPDEARKAEERERARQVEPQEDPLDSLDLDPSMKAFLMLEKKLGQSKS